MTTRQKNIRKRQSYLQKTNPWLQLIGAVIAKKEPKNSNVKTSDKLKI